MSNKMISQMGEITTLAVGDYFPFIDISQTSAALKNKRTTLYSVANFLGTLQYITQAAHGFAVGNLIRFNTSTETWVKSQANTVANAIVDAIVTQVVDANNFYFTSVHGVVISGFGAFVVGSKYYLDNVTAGAYTATPPAIERHVFTAIDNDSLIFHNTSGASGGGGSDFSDAAFSVYNDSDITKLFQTDLSGMTTGKYTKFTFLNTENNIIYFPNATGSDTVMYNNTEAQVANKTFDTTCEFNDSDDHTKFLTFNLSGMTTAKAATLVFENTTTKSYTFPDIANNDTVVLALKSQTLANKILLTSGYIADFTDASKYLTIQLSGATVNKKTCLIFNQTDNRNITFPDTDGTVIVGLGTNTYIPIWTGEYTQSGSASLIWDNTNTAIGVVTIKAVADSSNGIKFTKNDGTTVVGVFDTNNGRLGIGNLSAPNYDLSFSNSGGKTIAVESTSNTVDGRALSIGAGSTVTGGTADMAGGNLTLYSGLGKGIGESNIIFKTGRTLTTGSTLQTLTEAMRITGAGSVGIGITPTTERLHTDYVLTNPQSSSDANTFTKTISGTTANVAQTQGTFKAIMTGTATTPSTQMLAVAGQFYTSTVLTKNDMQLATSFSNVFGNASIVGFAYGTTTGINIGGFMEAINGNVNVGYVGKAITAKANTTNCGLIGVGRNTNTTNPVEVGVFAYLATLNNPTMVSSALLADNGTSISPIFIARDNGIEVFKIADGGNIGLGNITIPSFSLSFGNAAARTISIEPTASGIVGRDLTISSGSTVVNANIAGSGLNLNAGLGSGSGLSNFIVSTGQSTDSGTLQTLTERLRINNNGSTSERLAIYKYLDASPTADTVGDVRFYATYVVTTSTFFIEKCTVANAAKGGGTWVAITSFAL